MLAQAAIALMHLSVIDGAEAPKPSLLALAGREIFADLVILPIVRVHAILIHAMCSVHSCRSFPRRFIACVTVRALVMSAFPARTVTGTIVNIVRNPC